MATATLAQKSEVLNSWKEIAAYLGRGVRTVQRYERELGLPVRRPRGKSRSAVIALTEDIDAWLHRAPTSELRTGPRRRPQSFVITQVHSSDGEGSDLRLKCNQLRTAHRAEVDKLVENLSSLMKELRTSSALKKAGGGHSLVNP